MFQIRGKKSKSLTCTLQEQYETDEWSLRGKMVPRPYPISTSFSTFLKLFHLQWRPIVLPDNYIEQASPQEQLSLAGLTGNHIAATALSLLGRPREALLMMY